MPTNKDPREELINQLEMTIQDLKAGRITVDEARFKNEELEKTLRTLKGQ